jgi:tetratricopeptide (TPR) repeat protein
MLKVFLLFILFANTVLAAKLTLDDRRKKILAIVDEELSEVSRLSRQQNYKNPDTLLRVSELNLEKARLYREVENEQYLAIPVEQRVNVNKDDYFRESNKYFESANEAALKVVKKFKKYSAIGDVYYILAYNFKELGNNSEAMRYFKMASGSSKDPKILGKSKLALADFYFNEKKYADAIPLYESTLNTSDKWWTKDAFNLAWSYYRMKNFDRAISLMNEVHKKSGGKYVDMRSQVERDIGIFYVDANRLNDAINFFERQGLNYTDQFIKIANTITAQGRFDQAENLLQKVKGIEKDRTKKIEILLAELALFDKYNKNTEHLSASRELVSFHQKSPLEKSQFDKLNFQVNKKAAELQKAVAADIYKNVPKVKDQKAKEAIAYFELASVLSPGQRAEKIFFQAETAYAAKNFSKSLGLYIEAFDAAKNNNEKKILSQSMEGMLSSLGQDTLSKKAAEKAYIPVYSRYISMDSKSDRASTIFVKLFNAQFDAGDIPSAEKTMSQFASNFPKDFKTQEGMLAKVMEHYRSKKDYGTVKSYVKKINSGDFKVSGKYAEALRSLMTKIQIEGVQQSLEKGDKAVALKGYAQIYESSESTKKAKINAAYNMAALYFELGDTTQSYEWSLVALKDMEVTDVVKFADSFLSIAAGMFLRQQFTQSADMSHKLLEKLCKENSSNKVVAFKNAVFIALANGDMEKALDVKNSGRGCSIPDATISEVTFEILKDLAKLKRWDSYESNLKELESNSKNVPLLIRPYEDLRIEFLNIGSNEEARLISEKQNKFYQQSRVQKLEIPVEALDLIADRMLGSVIDKRNKLNQIALTFPEEIFNTTVKNKLQILDQMTSEVNTIQKIGSGKGIVEAYKIVIEAYETFGMGLKNFVPEGKAPEYVESFKKAMADVHGPILANAQKQRSEIKKLILENKILSLTNYAVLFTESGKDKRYVTEKESVLMDRGGRK